MAGVTAVPGRRGGRRPSRSSAASDGEREAGAGGGAGGGDGQRQRQPRAPVDDARGRLRFAGHPVGAEPAGEQVARLGAGQQVQGQRLGAFGGDQRR